MIVRALSAEDISQIVELQTGVFADGWSEGMLKGSFDTGRFLGYGVFKNDHLVCFATATLSVDTADIEDVLTHPDFRRKGFAEMVLERLFEDINSHGIYRVLLEVRESNAQAISLYDRLGFKRVSIRKNYYPDGENAIVMCKEK